MLFQLPGLYKIGSDEDIASSKAPGTFDFAVSNIALQKQGTKAALDIPAVIQETFANARYGT